MFIHGIRLSSVNANVLDKKKKNPGFSGDNTQYMSQNLDKKKDNLYLSNISKRK